MALTKFNYNSFDVTPVASKALAFNSDADGLTTAAEGSMVLIKTLTASSDDTLEFQDGTDDVVLDSTYPTYLFMFINMHPSVNNLIFEFQGNVAGGSGYNETITSSSFRAYHSEAASSSLAYVAGDDLAQGTDHQHLANGIGNGNDESLSGELWLFNPSSTTFVKHFMARCNFYEAGNMTVDHYTSGYFNTTSAIDEIQFKMASGNIDAGTFKLYGIKDS